MTKVGDGNNAGMQDISREEMSSHKISKTKGGQVEVRQKLDGKIESNIVYGENFPKESRELFDEKMLEFQGTLDDVRQQAAQARANGQPNLAAELEHQADRLQTNMNDMKIGIEKANLSGISAVDFGTLSRISVSFGNIESKTIADIRAIQKNAGVDSADFAATQHEAMSDAVGTGSSEAGKADMTDDEKYELYSSLMENPDQLVRDFESDPKGFFDQLKGLDSEQRRDVIMSLQNQIQSDNQLFSTLSNMIKAIHDTEKAVIGNLRV